MSRTIPGSLRSVLAPVLSASLILAARPNDASPQLPPPPAPLTIDTPTPPPTATATPTPAPTRPAESALAIAHDPLACVVTEELPSVKAGVSPERAYRVSYVFFRAEKYARTKPAFYYVAMAGSPESLLARLPRPQADAGAVEYYVQAEDTATLRKRTQTFAPKVTEAAACDRRGGVAPPKEGAGLTVGLTRDGQDPIPPGFNRADITKIILASGAIVSLGAALELAGGGAAASTGGAGATTGGAASGASSAGTGSGAAGGAAGSGAAASAGGISTGVLIGGGAVLVGAGVAIAAGGGGGKSAPAPTATNTPTATPTRTPFPPLRYVEADATWSGPDDLDLSIVGPTSGTRYARDCGTSESRTERYVLQGSLSRGAYQVQLAYRPCSGAAGSVTAVVSVFTEAGPVKAECANRFVTISGSQPTTVCTFEVP